MMISRLRGAPPGPSPASLQWIYNWRWLDHHYSAQLSYNYYHGAQFFSYRSLHTSPNNTNSNMKVLNGDIPQGAEANANQLSMDRLTTLFRTNLNQALLGGGEKARAKHKNRVLASRLRLLYSLKSHNELLSSYCRESC